MVLLQKRCIVALLLLLGLTTMPVSPAYSATTEKRDTTDTLAEDSSTTEVVLQDPVASYQGRDIQKSDFLDFIEGSKQHRPETYSSEAQLKKALLSYLFYLDFTEKGRHLPELDKEKVALELEVLKTRLLANIMQNDGNPFSEVEFETKVLLMEDPQWSPAKRDYFAQQDHPQLTSDEIAKSSELQAMILEEIKEVEVYVEAAKKDQMEVSRDYLLREQWVEAKYFSDHYVNAYIAQLPQTREDIAISFQKWVLEQDFSRYKVSHIYVEDAALAQTILAKIQAQTLSFTEAVEQFSLDTKTIPSGGKLNGGDWVTFMYADHPFSKAVSQLAVGELSLEVIQGVSGYHIIMLHDRAAGEMPDYMRSEKFQKMIWREDQLKQMYETLEAEMLLNIYQ